MSKCTVRLIIFSKNAVHRIYLNKGAGSLTVVFNINHSLS